MRRGILLLTMVVLAACDSEPAPFEPAVGGDVRPDVVLQANPNVPSTSIAISYRCAAELVGQGEVGRIFYVGAAGSSPFACAGTRNGPFDLNLGSVPTGFNVDFSVGSCGQSADADIPGTIKCTVNGADANGRPLIAVKIVYDAN
ncbi:MAG: hypothetical protein ABFS46_08065 [Myxococcota bacterium]